MKGAGISIVKGGPLDLERAFDLPHWKRTLDPYTTMHYYIAVGSDT